MPQYACGGRRSTCGNQFSLSTKWTQGTELRLLCLAASTFTCFVILYGQPPLTLKLMCSSLSSDPRAFAVYVIALTECQEIKKYPHLFYFSGLGAISFLYCLSIPVCLFVYLFISAVLD